jgi:hypothetical protein
MLAVQQSRKLPRLAKAHRGSIPRPSAKFSHQGGQARWEEQRTPNPLLQGSNPWSPAK